MKKIIAALLLTILPLFLAGQEMESFEYSFLRAKSFRLSALPGSIQYGGIDQVAPSQDDSRLYLSPSLIQGIRGTAGIHSYGFFLSGSDGGLRQMLGLAGYWTASKGQKIALNYVRANWGAIPLGDQEDEDLYLNTHEEYISCLIGRGEDTGFRWGIGAKLMLSQMLGIGDWVQRNGASYYRLRLIPSLVPVMDLGIGYATSGESVLKHDFGIGIHNLGPKFKDYPRIPMKYFTPVRLSAAYQLQVKLSEFCTISAAYQVDKIMAPGVSIIYSPVDTVNSDRTFVVKEGGDPYVGVFRGMVQSFSDSPDGWIGEIHEIEHRFGFGIAIMRNDWTYNISSGLHYQHQDAGNLGFFSGGIQAQYKSVSAKLGYARSLSPKEKRSVQGLFFSSSYRIK